MWIQVGKERVLFDQLLHNISANTCQADRGERLDPLLEIHGLAVGQNGNTECVVDVIEYHQSLSLKTTRGFDDQPLRPHTVDQCQQICSAPTRLTLHRDTELGVE
jgi:hypothetical protein